MIIMGSGVLIKTEIWIDACKYLHCINIIFGFGSDTYYLVHVFQTGQDSIIKGDSLMTLLWVAFCFNCMNQCVYNFSIVIVVYALFCHIHVNILLYPVISKLKN
jgi:hypothetical protein